MKGNAYIPQSKYNSRSISSQRDIQDTISAFQNAGIRLAKRARLADLVSSFFLWLSKLLNYQVAYIENTASVNVPFASVFVKISRCLIWIINREIVLFERLLLSVEYRTNTFIGLMNLPQTKQSKKIIAEIHRELLTLKTRGDTSSPRNTVRQLQKLISRLRRVCRIQVRSLRTLYNTGVVLKTKDFPRNLKALFRRIVPTAFKILNDFSGCDDDSNSVEQRRLHYSISFKSLQQWLTKTNLSTTWMNLSIPAAIN